MAQWPHRDGNAFTITALAAQGPQLQDIDNRGLVLVISPGLLIELVVYLGYYRG